MSIKKSDESKDGEDEFLDIERKSNTYVLNAIVEYEDDMLDGEQGYNISLKLFSSIVCIYKHYQKEINEEANDPFEKARDLILKDEFYSYFALESCRLQIVDPSQMTEIQKLVTVSQLILSSHLLLL